MSNPLWLCATFIGVNDPHQIPGVYLWGSENYSGMGIAPFHRLDLIPSPCLWEEVDLNSVSEPVIFLQKMANFA